MQTGEIEANLLHLNEVFKLPYIPDLIQRKLTGAEKSKLTDADLSFHQAEYERLRAALEQAHDASTLPKTASAWAALDALLVRVRLSTV